jgi:hypothetical protein
MTLTITLAAACVALALAVLCGWLGARPPDPTRGPRLVPWRMLMLISAAGVLALLVHAANLLRVKDGG